MALATGVAKSQVLRGANNKQPVLVSADNLKYDRENDVITATGRVRVSQGDNVILADRLIYNRRTKILRATGNVSISRPSGETIFATRVVLTDDLKNGVIHQFRLLFPDKSRFAANGAVRVGGTRDEMAKVVFSPCNLCEKDPTAAPLWQIKARKVVHLKKSRDLVYRDAYLEVFGVPVFYSPYFRHPDPTVRRRSGFLVPSFGSDSRLGQFLKVPYFYVISRDKDITIAPFLTTRERAALFATYRQRFKNGAVILDGGYTYVRRVGENGGRIGGNRSRGHLFSKVAYDINSHWRFTFTGGVTTDDTYLRRYSVTGTDVLTTSPKLEGFYGRDYYAAQSFVFQGLRTEDDFDRDVIVFPLLTFTKYGRSIPNWGRWRLGGSLIGAQRIDGADSQRLHANAGWRLPFTHRSGWQLTLSADLNFDLYLINNWARPNGSSFNGFLARAYPIGRIDWRYPFVRELGNVRNVIEPRVALIVAPSGLNTSKIPNEDSQDVGFDDANLFAINRFNGRDRVDEGTRLVYGLRTAFFGNRGGRTDLFLGQSLRISGSKTLASDAVFRDTLSDLVGRIQFEPGEFLSLAYRFRFDLAAMTSRRHELTASFGVPALRAFVNYVKFSGNGTTEPAGRSELVFSLNSQITKTIAAFGSARIDLARDGGTRRWQIGAQFKNECCTIRATFTRTFFIDRDIRPSSQFLIQISLKHLGQFNVSR